MYLNERSYIIPEKIFQVISSEKKINHTNMVNINYINYYTILSSNGKMKNKRHTKMTKNKETKRKGQKDTQ